MTGEQEALVTDNIALARFLAGRYIGSLGEDAFSEACVGLVKAALAFDPSKGKFGSYAALRINGALLDEIRHRTPLSRYWTATGADQPHIGSLEVLTEAAGFNPIDGDPLPDEQAEQSEIKRRVLAAMTKLAGRDAAVVSGYYVEGLPLAAIARQLGISESRSSQLNKRALGVLRQELADLEPEVCCA